jgi:hypothetical protein
MGLVPSTHDRPSRLPAGSCDQDELAGVSAVGVVTHVRSDVGGDRLAAAFANPDGNVLGLSRYR